MQSKTVRLGSVSEFWTDRYARRAVVVRRAVDRGELSRTTDAHQVLLAATRPIYHELVLLRGRMQRATADRYARAAAAVARGGLGSSHA